MTNLRVVSLVFLFLVLFLITGRESLAVIYKYTNEKGVPTYADDMQKIPEQYRAQAVIVSGAAVDEQTEAERARQEAEERARREQTVLPEKAGEPFSARLVRSGTAVGLFLAALFVISNIDALKEQAKVLSRVRTLLILLLLVFLSVTHVRDVIRLFGKAGEAVSNPVSDIRERSAERGRKAAESYKGMDKVLQQKAAEDEERLGQIDKKFEEAERGK